MTRVTVIRWLCNAALAALVLSALDPHVSIGDGLSLVGLGLVIGIDVSRGEKVRVV